MERTTKCYLRVVEGSYLDEWAERIGRTSGKDGGYVYLRRLVNRLRVMWTRVILCDGDLPFGDLAALTTT